MKKRLLFLFAILLLFFACSKDNNELLTISGFTERNNSAELTGDIDITDWTSDDIFPDVINPLFNFADTLDYTNDKISTVEIIEYPNPFESIFCFSLNLSEKTAVKLVIVDQHLKVYSQYAINLQQGYNILSLQTNNGFPRYKSYRVYYAFYDNSKNIYYKGHGDIIKK